jgi:ABC-type Mn2+/Zn2+ transport system permease subunit
MKRVMGVLLAIAVLAGVAFTAQLWSARPPGENVPASTGNPLGSFIGAVQMSGFPLPDETVSIVLSSLVLLGSTTLLRRHLTNRQALRKISKPKWLLKIPANLQGAGEGAER